MMYVGNMKAEVMARNLVRKVQGLGGKGFTIKYSQLNVHK